MPTMPVGNKRIKTTTSMNSSLLNLLGLNLLTIFAMISGVPFKWVNNYKLDCYTIIAGKKSKYHTCYNNKKGRDIIMSKKDCKKNYDSKKTSKTSERSSTMDKSSLSKDSSQ